MFSLKIVDTDAFLEMPSSSQLLYFHLSMRADDEGFVGSPRKIIKMGGFSSDDFKILVAKRFILTFESGVVVIKHWLIHNNIRQDRISPTKYSEERKSLKIKENGAYTEMSDKCLTNDGQMSAQIRLDQVSIGKGRESFAPPSLGEVSDYCKERGNAINPEQFINFYESKGWLVGSAKMKSWQAAVRTWEQRNPRPKEERILRAD